MSHIDRILYKVEEARKTVLALTGITEEELSEMQFLLAYECLERVIGKDDLGKKELPLTSKFWDWWKDQWYRRDKVFLDKMVLDTNLMRYIVHLPQYNFPVVLKNEQAVKSAYKLFHKMDADNNLVNNAVLEQSFYQLLRESKQ